MRLSHITISGFKSFAKKTTLDVTHNVTGIVGPNGSGKSNIAEAIRFVLGEQSVKSLRGKSGSDVIFKGSERLSSLSRASVTMVIDNRDRKSKVDSSHASEDLAPFLVYDELVLSRVIYKDSTSDYLLNDAKVRLKDVQELLSFAGIGGSAHTIINQGEADRILLATPKDKKEALDDALGLRVYHMRLNESKRKLERVKTHVNEVELLRKEIRPHLSHLERQVKKIESQEEERQKLLELLVVYLHREEKEIGLLNERILEQGTSVSLSLITDSIKKELEVLKAKKIDPVSSAAQEKRTLQAESQSLLLRKDQLAKTLGRLEGEKSHLEKELGNVSGGKDIVISNDDFSNTHAVLSHKFEELLRSISSLEISNLISKIKELSDKIESFFSTYGVSNLPKKESIKNDLAKIVSDIFSHEEKTKVLDKEISSLQEKINKIDKNTFEEMNSRHEHEKKILSLESKSREINSTIALRKQEEGELAFRKSHFGSLLEEGTMIVGKIVLEYKKYKKNEKYNDTQNHDLLKSIERCKLRIEEASIPNREDVIKEYKTTRDREEYLTRELSDIKASEEKLLSLINDLTKSLEEKFSTGIKEVSNVFGEFFEEIFNGGKGKLILEDLIKIDEEGKEIIEQGIDIDVSLPNKKVKELSMFSGGERALVSIALLFAMSSITPPPFMVLDETDAPLDEVNARKYGFMLKRLAEKSKLLIITHNRETMNHCDMLYGVTVGVDGGSKLLSINLKEAVEIVK